MEQEPTYHLEGVIRSKEEMADFEGPLTLILMLLSRNKIEIRDIQISAILEQYLAYLDEMKSLDLEIASEFVQMAAHLLYIKTKMLLSTEDGGADELELLIASLEELKAREVYTAIREQGAVLLKASEYGALYQVKPPEALPMAQEYVYSHASWELLRALAQVFRRSRLAEERAEEIEQARRRRLFPKRIVYPVREKSHEILLRLTAGGRLPLREFYRESRSRSEVVATFLSILELCSLGHTSLVRDGGEVYVDFSGGDADVVKILESIDTGTDP